jgi:hypothetical protein
LADEPDRDVVARAWTHSPEDDVEGRMVFRPSAYDFPPARAPRVSVELLPDGALRYGGPGPADRREWSQGKWELVGRELRLQIGGGPAQRYAIEHIDDERLVVTPK